jgi:coenzyme F420-reducing hydrogenase alpha subunit
VSGNGSEPRRIDVPILTRVEGEGALRIVVNQGKLEKAELNIYEPPRFFEAFLRSRSIEEVADITARICGICPIAYQMTALQAIEQALGIDVPKEIQKLRRLMYFGEWIESHALHIHLLHAPDFFGCESGLALAKKNPEAVQRGLKIKKIGNRLLEVLGGRAIHPVNLAVGGFFRLPRREELHELIDDFNWGLEASIGAAKWIGGLDFPEFHSPSVYVAMQHPEEYALMHGHIACSDRTKYSINDYEKHFTEEHVAHSTALHSRRNGDSATYQVGPLARVNLNFEQLSPAARQVAEQLKWNPPCSNPFESIFARILEVIHSFEEGLEIIKAYRPLAEPRVRGKLRSSEGCSATEAPRGLIYHRYRIDSEGLVEFAKIVPPTSQNQKQIESDLRAEIPPMLDKTNDEIALHCEKLIRNYDPCISCSTHFLKLERVDSSEDSGTSTPSSL